MLLPMFNLDFNLELIDIHINPRQKVVSLTLCGATGDIQANICVATIPYDSETERQAIISKMEEVTKQLQDLQRWQEEKLTTKR